MAADGYDDTDDVGGAAPAPPAPPPGAPGDWSAVVRHSAWSDIERLGLWKGGNKLLPDRTDPSGLFGTVGTQTLGAGANPPTIYVVVHGWAPGYRAAVTKAGGAIKWWSSDAHVSGRWASDWCWSRVIAPATWFRSEVVINPNGVLQQIADRDRTATVLAYSWIDDSATDSGVLHTGEVYASEAYTHLNGIRLANALERAIQKSFFDNGGQLRLIGHSHGSKVCTVAAKTLQERKKPATHLTILDAPESNLTLFGNGANLLGFYLEQLKIRDPSAAKAPGLYVDNYTSCFGVTYDSAQAQSPVKNVVEVNLAPSHIYWSVDLTDCHTYAAAWYGGAADGAAKAKLPPIGLAWPPVPPNHTPAMLQRFGGPGLDQWTLTQGHSLNTHRYATDTIGITKASASKGVVVGPGEISFRWASGDLYSTYVGHFRGDRTHQYGIAFDVDWASPSPGELFVISIGLPGNIDTSTLLVLDGRSIPPQTKTSIAVNADYDTSQAEIHMFFLADAKNPGDVVKVSNIRDVLVSSV